jgi:hypothetical protein
MLSFSMSIMEPKDQLTLKAVENKRGYATSYAVFSNGSTAIACASGGALLGTNIAGPVGGFIGAIISGVAGYLLSGSHTSAPHDK